MIDIEVVYAAPRRQSVVALRVEEGTTLVGAIARSGLAEGLPEGWSAGVFGKRRPLDAVVQAGDRVEIYRALVEDPKARRRRAAQGRKG